jgi:hypothetical protein
MKGNTMSKPKRGNGVCIDVPGLAYYAPEVARPSQSFVPAQPVEMAELDQMCAYFCDEGRNLEPFQP